MIRIIGMPTSEKGKWLKLGNHKLLTEKHQLFMTLLSLQQEFNLCTLGHFFSATLENFLLHWQCSSIVVSKILKTRCFQIDIVFNI